ncbi:hypothetical protein COX08_02890 [Candidatus Beckwithbacteria bacterium CG23_combo_of_CG06-09_8_20_14_all_34_8]|uniref:Uncharacterized protein n=1 Tax=Candidatus Beckwithbacteria bacterium CG23_combo_of_CG06-09_8_20_14_all_34_8 TaxID=1974497 RepID=A0A2H0B636_9BACT|nr:MAG: hypothetical protein COX08_02890 [Candidatus Beckwithbacteria bacterium CG23_combo_of_CG06-09_8_20_14_all_34_8]
MFNFIFSSVAVGFFSNMDGELHLGRIGVYTHELRQGQFPVRWSEILNYGYGSPIFNFVYPLPYFSASILHLIGLPLSFSIKIIIILSWILSGIFMYLALSKWTKNKLASVIGALFYIAMPYRIMDVYVRMAFGEHVAFVFPPLIMLGYLYFKQDKNINGLFWVTIAVAGLILSHNALAIMFLILLYAIAIFDLGIKNIKKISFLSLAFFGGLLISAFFWLSSLYEMKYTLTKIYLSDKNFHDYFLNLAQVWWMPWSFSNKHTPTYIGISGLITTLLAIITVLKTKSKTIIFLLVFLGLTIFITTPLSVWFWERIPIIQFFQTPWRFLSIAVYIISLLIAYSLKNNKNYILGIILVVVLLIEVVPNIKVSKLMSVDDSYYNNYPLSTTWHHEGAPIWTAGEATEFPPQRFQLLGDGEIKFNQENTLAKNIKVFANQDSRLIYNHYYFPGWKVFVDQKPVEVQFQDPQYRGLITFDIAKGNHNVEIIFGKTKIRLVSEFLSLIGILFFIGLTIRTNFRSKI